MKLVHQREIKQGRKKWKLSFIGRRMLMLGVASRNDHCYDVCELQQRTKCFIFSPSLPMCSLLIWESTHLVLCVIREDCCVNHCVSAILSSPCPHPVFVLYLISSTGKIILESRVKGSSQVHCEEPLTHTGALCGWKTSSLLSMFILCFV